MLCSGVGARDPECRHPGTRAAPRLPETTHEEPSPGPGHGATGGGAKCSATAANSEDAPRSRAVRDLTALTEAPSSLGPPGFQLREPGRRSGARTEFPSGLRFLVRDGRGGPTEGLPREPALVVLQGRVPLGRAESWAPLRLPGVYVSSTSVVLQRPSEEQGPSTEANKGWERSAAGPASGIRRQPRLLGLPVCRGLWTTLNTDQFVGQSVGNPQERFGRGHSVRT